MARPGGLRGGRRGGGFGGCDALVCTADALACLAASDQALLREVKVAVVDEADLVLGALAAVSALAKFRPEL